MTVDILQRSTLVLKNGGQNTIQYNTMCLIRCPVNFTIGKASFELVCPPILGIKMSGNIYYLQN